jgi:hypothetical protein
MSTILKALGAAVSLAILLPQIAGANDYNKRPHLDPRSNAKVNRYIAKSWLERGKGKESFENVRSGQGCGNQIIGDFSNMKNPPREVIIVADEIININQNCRR